jgi:nucleoid-associated protein YgaU
MRDYAKLVILGSTALLVLLAVCLVVFPLLLWPHEGKTQTERKGGELESRTATEVSSGTESVGQSQGGTQQTAVLPETVELGKDFTFPCAASLTTVVEKYYKAVKLNNGALVPITDAQLPEVIKRLAKYNNIADPAASQPAGTVLKMPRVYVVSRDDSSGLGAIAGKLYGNKNKWKDIHNLNKDIMPDANKISIGMVLILP